MSQAVRVGDIGSGHDGYPDSPVEQGSPNVFINGIPATRVGDKVKRHCKKSCHNRTIQQGSPNVFINGIPATRVGDKIDCGGKIITGSPNVFIN